MTGYESKKAAARDKLDDDDALTIAYQSGYYDGKKAAQPAQEPVAWCSQCGHKCPLPAQEPVAHLCKPDQHGLFAPPTPDKACKDCFPVYTTPPQRPWVGLTDEQLYEIVRSGGKVLKDDAWEIVEKLQAKLKENT
jgi:hypothetical protein